jgi:hypothetical protein
MAERPIAPCSRLVSTKLNSARATQSAQMLPASARATPCGSRPPVGARRSFGRLTRGSYTVCSKEERVLSGAEDGSLRMWAMRPEVNSGVASSSAR